MDLGDYGGGRRIEGAAQGWPPPPRFATLIQEGKRLMARGEISRPAPRSNPSAEEIIARHPAQRPLGPRHGPADR